MHVYVITNTVNGKLYVGQHVKDDLERYLQENIKAAFRGSTEKRLLYRAMRKHGPSSFNIRSIYTAKDKSEMDRAEKAFIKLFGTRGKDLGYNLTDGGEGVLGLVCTEETRKKLSVAILARGGISEKCRLAQKAYLDSRVFTEEYRKKLRESKKGKKLSEDHRKKLSLAKKGSKQNLSAEQRNAISFRMKEWWAMKKQEVANAA